MAQKRGRVTSINEAGWAMVVTEKGDVCSNCESAQFCHSLADCSKMETRVLNRANAGVGDQVIISLSSNSVFKSAVILYILPTLSLLFGAIAGSQLHNHIGISETGGTILFAFVGLILGFSIAVLISKHQKSDSKLIPVITRIVSPTNSFDTKRTNTDGYPHARDFRHRST
jgi:sigma-E factor negative regulatory protein RseC